MKLPLLVSALITAESGEDDRGYEIYLNRSGINSIEIPRGRIQVAVGGQLRLNFLNRGAPIHITITSSNAGMYTSFFHENLYVVDSVQLTLPISNEAQDGSFDLEILSGYGVTKTILHVNVVAPATESKAEEKPDFPLQPVPHGRPHLLMVMMGVALILYCGWLYNSQYEILNIAAFITLIIGALYTWYRQK
jgi:hypothetical protein